MAHWYDITRSEKYQELDEADKLQMKQLFFEKHVIPKLDEDDSLKGRQEVYDAAFRQFMQTPDDTGQGYVSSMLGSAGRGFGEMVPGAIEGVGALTQIEPLREFGQDVRSGLEDISPVNPIYAESVPVKLAGVGGQIGSVLATGGAGGLAGKALGGVGAVSKGAKAAALGSAFLQGAAEGRREAEQYGMAGPEAYLRTLAGGAIEAGSEFLPFGLGAETALAKRVLSGAPRTGTFLGAVGSEAGEEGVGQFASNVATRVLAPSGTQTPELMSGVLESAAYGAAGGGMLGGINAFISTPPDKQTDIQKSMAAEIGAVPKDEVPDQTNEKKLAAMQAGGTTVVDPDGKTAVIVPKKEPIPAQVQQQLAEEPSMLDPVEVATSLNTASVQDLANADSRLAAAAQDGFKKTVEEILQTPEPTVQPKQAAETPTPEVTLNEPTVPEEPELQPENIPNLEGGPFAEAKGPVSEEVIQPTPQALNAPDQITDQESLRQELQDRTGGRETEETGVSDSLRSQEEVEEEVITPKGTPTPATEGMVTPGGVATERDLTKGEQMTPVEVRKRAVFKKDGQWYSGNIDGQSIVGGSENYVNAQGENRQATIGAVRWRSKREALAALEGMHARHVSSQLRKGSPVSAAAVDTYGITLPEGYVKQGDLYVFQPGATGEPVQAAPSAAQVVGTTATGPVSKALSEDEIEALRDVINLRKQRGQNTSDLEAKLAQAAPSQAPDFIELNPETPYHPFTSEKPLLPIKVEVSDGGIRTINASAKALEKERASLVKKKQKAKGANAITLDADIYAVDKALAELGRVGRELEQYLSKKLPQTTTVATNETAPPSAKGEAVASAVEQPVEGSIPTVPTRETPKTDLSTPESKAADQEEQDAQERQKKQRKSIRKSLDSIIDKRKTNIVQGTVTAADVEAARTELNNSGEIPNAFLTRIYESPKEFLADKSNERYFPSSYADLQANSNIEGLFENGQTLIFVKNIGVSDLDRDIAKNLGISPELAAARRVIAHENGHRGVSLFTLNERREFIRHIRQMYSDEEIQNLVRLYTKYADWRTNPDSRDAALEELFMKKFDSLKKIPTGGVWDDIVQFLKKVWRRLTGSKDEPTLNDMKDVVRLLRNAMQRAAVEPSSFTLNNGGEVRLSLSDRFKGVTPAQDAEYLAAVEAGDMEKVQRMVDEAAKAAGYSVGTFIHRTDSDFNSFLKSKGWTWFNTDESLDEDFQFTYGDRRIDAYLDLSRKYTFDEDFQPWESAYQRNAELASLENKGITSIQMPSGDVAVANPNQIKSATPVTYDGAGNVIPLSQRFQAASPDIRYSLVEFASPETAAFNAGSEAARDTIYNERDMDVREAIRRAYQPTENSVAVPLDELFAKAKDQIPDLSEDEFSNVLQDLYEDSGAVLQEGAIQISGEPLTSNETLEKDNPFNELIRKSTSKSPSVSEINSVSKKFITRFIRPDSSFARQNDIRIDGDATLQARALPDGGIVIGYSLSQDSFDGLQKMAPQAASQYTKDAAIEELIHLSDLIGLRNQWLKSGKQIPFDQFVLNEQSNLAFSLIQQADSLSDSEAESLRKILASSLSLYDNKADIAKLGLNELLDLAAQYSFVLPELIRSLIQLKKTGQITETAFRKIANVLRQWQETVLQWLNDGYTSAKNGVFGDLLADRIKNAEANLDILSGNTFDVFTPEGRRAGFAVIMPRQAMASRISEEDAEKASKTFREDLVEAGKGRVDTRAFEGRELKGTEAPEHNVNAPELYKKAAKDLIQKLEDQKHDIIDIAKSLQDPKFQISVGMQVGDDVSSDMISSVRVYIGLALQNRIENEAKKARTPLRKRQLEVALRNANVYYQAVTGIGKNLNLVGQGQKDPEFKWMILTNNAQNKKAEVAKERLDALTGGTNQITNTINESENEASIEAVKALEAEDAGAIEDDQDAIDLAEGEATLDTRGKNLWEKFKDLIRKRGIAMRALNALRAGNRAKASISSEERNAISQMSEEELIKFIADIDNEMASVFDEFTKTPATRKKREKMVATAKKRAEQGKPIEAPSLSKKELIEQMLVGFNDRDSIINEVGDALLKAAEQRKAKPKQKTAIQDLIAAIRQTLTANLKGDQIKADQPSLGKLLGKTFAQQGSEAALFAKSWEDGRKKVRAMLSEMGVDDASLEEELDAIMPPTPTLAYAPAAAKRAITMAIKEAGLSSRDAISNPAFFRETIMEKFNEAAAKENLTEEGWNQSGKALAEKAINEFIDSARIKAEERLAESKDKMEKRKVEIADKRASQLIYSVEELFRQNSKDIQTSKSGDSINKAFRDQVKEPVSIGKFKERLAKLSVSDQVAERLFKTAAREKADLQAMKAFEFLEGPNARQNLLREMNKARPASQVPLERAMPWKDILSQKSQNVEEYRQRIFDAISSLPAMENITEDQKQRLAELYAEAFEEKREEILKRILEREEARLFNSNAITKKAAKALQESRNKIIELVNLGGFNNDDLVKILGERFGISTSFTEEQKAKITDLAEKLQDEDMNQAKRNKLAMQFVVELAGATDASVTEILSNWWTSSVLFGPQTIFSIGAAFLNGGYNIITVGINRTMSKLFKGDFVGAIDESIVILKGIARYLGAFKQSGRRAWNYLWSGEVEQLGASANDILGEIKSFDDLQKFKRHKLLAENLAKDPRALRRYVGQYLRFVNRLLTALDSFNVMVTKAGTTSLALRMSGLDPNKIVEAEKMLNLKSYKQDIIDKEFGGVAPTNSLEKGRLDSYAEAAMYKALDKFGGKMENADYFASDSAMTMNPTGLGGYFYRKITGIDKEARKSADEYLEKVKKNWMSQKDLDSFRDLSLAYIRQFFVYQAANLAGYKFIRYASNKFNQGISYLPLIGLARKFEAKGDEIKGKDAFIETIHRNQIIGALMTVVAASVIKALEDEPDDEKRGWLWNGGWENLTPDQKKQRLALGQKEYTFGFKYNGRWYYFNYLNWPINQPLSAIGSMSDQIRFSPQQWGEKGALSKITSGMVSGLKSTLDMPALSQLGEIFGSRISSKDPTERTIDRTSRVLSGWVGGFVPRVLKDIDFYTQPELRKYEGLWEKTASHIPIYRRYVGDEYYDILGHSIKRNVIPGSREFMAGPTEPEYKILGALNARNIWLTPANAEYRMIGKGRNRRRLTQEEADAYSLESGKAYRQMLLRYGQRALQMPTERARAFLLDKADEARDRALKKAVR